MTEAETATPSDNDLDIEDLMEKRREYDAAEQEERQAKSAFVNAEKVYLVAGEEWVVARALLKRAIEALNDKTYKIAYPVRATPERSADD